MDDSDRSPESILELTKEFKLGGTPSTTTDCFLVSQPLINRSRLSITISGHFSYDKLQTELSDQETPQHGMLNPKGVRFSCVEQSQWTPL